MGRCFPAARALVLQGSPLNALLSEVGAEQQQTVRQDSLWFKMSFLTNFTEVACSLEITMAILQPGSLARHDERVTFVTVKWA